MNEIEFVVRSKPDARFPLTPSLFRRLSRSEARRARAIAYEAALAIIG